MIDEIKALDPQERVKMFGFLLEVESDERIYAGDQSFDNAADRVIRCFCAGIFLAYSNR